jgi:hypothetical protein
MHYPGSTGKLQADLEAGAEIEIRGKIHEFVQAGRSYRDPRPEVGGDEVGLYSPYVSPIKLPPCERTGFQSAKL